VSSDGWPALERFLHTDVRDVGCERAMEIIHVYAELIVAGEEPDRQLPGVAAHIAACGPCREDLAGLLAAIPGRKH
jgi:hypothetical protein